MVLQVVMSSAPVILLFRTDAFLLDPKVVPIAIITIRLGLVPHDSVAIACVLAV